MKLLNRSFSFRQRLLPSLRSWVLPTLLGLVCFVVYNANLRQIGAGDTLPARFLPLILWQHGTLKLDESARLVAHGHSVVSDRNRPPAAEGKVAYFEPWAYWMVRTRQHDLASLYPVVTPLLVAPLYFPAVLWLDQHGWEQPQLGWVAEVMEKLSASVLAALASVVMYLLLRREGQRWALPLALAFAFGTNTWVISSQALWQHGAGELFIALALLLVTGPVSRGRTALLGAVCVLMAANRPPDALIAGAFGLFGCWSRPRNALWLLAGAAIPLAALLVYNLDFIGHVAGGYAVAKGKKVFFQQDWWSGMLGLLFSPARGLLVFSIFLIFVPVGLRERWRKPETRGLAVALGVAVAAQFLVYARADWRAGESWGPRWLTDVLPILVWMLAPAPLVLRPLARGLLLSGMVASIGAQAIGAFWYTKTSDDLIYASDPDSMRGAWNPRNIPFLTELRHPPAHGELLAEARGSLDRVGPALIHTLTEIPQLEPGAVLEGWALTGGRSPAELIVLIDGIALGSTQTFVPRVDVNEALHTTALSGWRMLAETRGISPGQRVLQVAVRMEPRSDLRIIREQSVMVIAKDFPEKIAPVPAQPASAADLETMAERAAARLRERQSEHGFWLTAFTNSLRYDAPQPEMNTYLTAILVDLLAPIAHPRGLDETLARARRHLAAQIESNGLVRYHGLPNGPTIGTLGCVITPDSDDTALAWRIAGLGAADPRAKPMLEELARYRDARGLYRTWLAPRKNYQNLDPGRDPNPTDLTIQLHVYLMLRALDLAAARALGQAIQRAYDDSDLWVYYTKAPLVPYLRSAELRQLGLDLPLPADRLELAAPGQEIWSEIARLLVKCTAAPPDASWRPAARNVLARLGSHDFAELRRTPPVLYHNDLSATVRRFYWSEDAGYALWLRLYEAIHGKAGLP